MMDSAKSEYREPVVRDPFNLSTLETVPAPDGTWDGIEAALRQQRRWKHSILGLSAAAVAVFALLTTIVQVDPFGPVAGTSQTSLAQEKPDSAPGLPDATSPVSGSVSDSSAEQPIDQLLALQQLSRQLERNVRLFRTEVGPMSARDVVYTIELEDLVAQVDQAINQQPGSRVLWTQRINLLMDLNRIYSSELRRNQVPLASL